MNHLKHRSRLASFVRHLLLIALTSSPALLAATAFAQASAAAGAKAASWRPVDRQRLAAADRLIDEAIARGELPGAVLLVGRGEEVIYRKAYGHRALKPEPEPMTVDTLFDLASLSKPVGCATSVMILVERGKVRLDEPVATYLPAFAANGKERVTVADLLLHRGGLVPDNDLSDYADGPAAAMKRVLAIKPQWEPETHFAYSDVGYIVLGELVKAVAGRPLDQFASEEVFAPLGMHDTTYNPPEAMHARCAPTEQRNGHWMRGEVHDPRSYALGGVAGHAGVFSTADDLSRFCRMVLNGGRLEGHRILNEQTVREMTRPRCLPDGTGLRCYVFDVATPYAPSPRGNRFEPGTTFGHTGFTGTMFWIDPLHDCYFILLTNSVHPDGKGNVIGLRRRVSTAVGEALLGALPGPATRPTTAPTTRPTTVKRESGSEGPGVMGSSPASQPTGILCGIDVLKAEGFQPLRGWRVALVTNHTGLDRQGNRTIDLLAGAEAVHLVKLFSPEHGLLGVKDEKVDNSTDPKTGLKVYSLYGKTNKPTSEMLDGVDTLVFDIQDAGARYYTYVSTMGLCMEAAAAHKLKMVVLDRPNPATGLIVDGPLADTSDLGFTAFAPIPVSHGMTVGELAGMFNTELGIHCDLTVIPLQGWRRAMWWDQTGLTWVNPSPNLRTPTADLLYLGVGLLEASNLSVGRGTDTPFEILGAPWVDGAKLAAALNGADLPGLRFVPVRFTPQSSRFAGKPCGGVRLLITDREVVEPVRSGLAIAWHLKHLFGDAYEIGGVGKLLKNRDVEAALAGAKDPAGLAELWRGPLEGFKKQREKYLLYR